MKSLLAFPLLPLFLWLWLGVGMAQPGPETVIPEAVEKELTLCLREGNADRLAVLFAERIDITSKGKREMYAREQAKFMLRQFFKDNQPSAFNVVHIGKAVENSYVLGDYLSKTGKRFRVNIFLNNHNGTFFIDHIRLEEHDAGSAATQRLPYGIPQTGN